ncbi:hypothetical protein [Micromonospora sp. Llam0]|uniref:hypothetical protein n=1 Tax=Micromonospora sp. Llam0 TaxID=2485143 RepID=UPI0011CDAE82|nr:hypothetical protein [Micromonospora sp. Llam0]
MTPDICGAAAAHTVIVTTADDTGHPTPVRPGVIRTGAYAGSIHACDVHRDQVAADLRGSGLVVDVITSTTPPGTWCGDVWRIAADGVLTPDSGPEHQALQRAAAATAPAPAGPVDDPTPAPAVDVAVDVVQRCGRPAVAGVATQPHPMRWTGPRTYAGTIWVCTGHEDVVTEQARTGGLDTGLVGAPERVRCGEISAEGVDLADVPAGAWPRLAVLAAANVTAAAPVPMPVPDGELWARADELRPGMWIATGRPDVPGVEVRAVEIGDTGLVGVLCSGPEYAEYVADQPVRLVDEATVAEAAEALRVRTRRQLMLDGLRALVAAAERDIDILPVDRLQVTGRAADLPTLHQFAAALGADVVQVGERLVAEVLTGGGPADDLGGSSAPISVEMYVYADPEPAGSPPARGTAAVVVPAQPTGGDL